MDINEFKRIISAFADEPSDVDVRIGKVVAQIRDELIDVTIKYSSGPNRELLIGENGQEYPARRWLINRVARLPQLADRIIASTTLTPEVEAKSPFVEPSGFLSPDLSAMKADDYDQPISDVVATLLDKASNPLPGATSVLYITSDAGEGKSTIINKMARQQAIKYKSKSVDSLVVPIPLNGRAFLTFDDAVIATLVNKWRFNYLYFDAFIQLVRMGVVVPAFDGYEEMLVEGSKGEAISALGNLVQTLESSGTVFIAARKAFFEYLSFKTQAKLLDAIGDQSASFSRLAISRWNKEQFCKYGTLRKANAPEEIYETVVTKLGPTHPLLTRAVLIRRLFDVAMNLSDRTELAELLVQNPHDYFFTFVDAIVKREATEKWLSRISGEIKEPLLKSEEHHQLLSHIALEMWQTSTNSLRYDVLDVLVDMFSEESKKRATDIRQIKERLKQHSLLSTDTSRREAISFDHEDFQNFFLGEGLGLLLSKGGRTELQAFLSVNLVPIATVEQAIQHLTRHHVNLQPILACLMAINESETGFSFCKENSGSLLIRLAECFQKLDNAIVLKDMFLSSGALTGRTLRKILFENCHFQPTATSKSSFSEVEFIHCEFERLETEKGNGLSGCSFKNSKIESLILAPEEEHTFNPALIAEWLLKAGAQTEDSQPALKIENILFDDRIKIFEKFLRVFLRSTFVDEEVIRIRLGKGGASVFFEEVLPALLENHILGEVPWKGQGSQRRYKMLIPMSEVSYALEKADNFEKFLEAILS